MRMKRLGLKINKNLMLSVLTVTVVSSLAFLYISGFFNQTLFDNSPKEVNGGIHWGGKTVVKFISGDSAALTVPAGSSISGIATMNILENATIRFFVDNGVGGFNTTRPTLPDGISVTVILNGNTYKPELYSEVGDLTTSSNPLIQVGPGVTTVQYTVSVAGTVPKGQYRFNIVCADFIEAAKEWRDFLKNGVLNQLEVLEVTLNVT
ncbi:MAG: hypothetical protein QW385_08360 [Thermoproteota archaeon]